jgi:hypothetical protein
VNADTDGGPVNSREERSAPSAKGNEGGPGPAKRPPEIHLVLLMPFSIPILLLVAAVIFVRCMVFELVDYKREII